jgi:hypothetical protein
VSPRNNRIVAGLFHDHVLQFMYVYHAVSRSDFNLFSKNKVFNNARIAERCAGLGNTAASISAGSGSYLSPTHGYPDRSHPWILCPFMKMSAT